MKQELADDGIGNSAVDDTDRDDICEDDVNSSVGDTGGGESGEGIGDAIPQQDAHNGFNGNTYHNVSADLLISTEAMKQCNAITLSRNCSRPQTRAIPST